MAGDEATGIKTEHMAKVVEAFFCLLAGLPLCALRTEGLGVFVMAGFISILLAQGLSQERLRQRDITARDAMMEMQQQADRLQGLREDY